MCSVWIVWLNLVRLMFIMGLDPYWFLFCLVTFISSIKKQIVTLIGRPCSLSLDCVTANSLVWKTLAAVFQWWKGTFTFTNQFLFTPSLLTYFSTFSCSFLRLFPTLPNTTAVYLWSQCPVVVFFFHYTFVVSI